MHPLKRISLFFCLCLLIYAALIAPWPGLMDGYRAFFRAGGNLLFGHLGSAASVTFMPLSSMDHTKDTTLVLMKKRPPPARGEMDITSVYMGYRPMVFFVALALATPIPFRRRLRTLVLGLVLVNMFIAFRVSLQILDAFSDRNALALFSLSPFWKDMLKVTIKVLVQAPAVHYMGPAFIWLIVAFRRGDLARVFNLPQPLAVATPPARSRRKRRKHR
jgi:hypothetical protein